MATNTKKDCPHVEKSNLIDTEKFKKIPFRELQCEKCEETIKLWICLICGEVYCSKLFVVLIPYIPVYNYT